MFANKSAHRRRITASSFLRVAIMLVLAVTALVAVVIPPSSHLAAPLHTKPAAPAVNPIPALNALDPGILKPGVVTRNDSGSAATKTTEPTKTPEPPRPVGEKMKVLFDGRNERSAPTTQGNEPLREFAYGDQFTVVAKVDGEDPYGTDHKTWLKTDKGTFVWNNDDIVSADAPVPAKPAPVAAKPAPPKPVVANAGAACVRPNGAGITSPYGWRTNDNGSSEFHKGIDFGGNFGSAILAARDGQVINAELTNNGFGAWVRIRHADGTVSVYGHINTWLVRAGEWVKAGKQIATVGNRGQSDGPHLHFGVDSNGNYNWISPKTWLASCGVYV